MTERPIAALVLAAGKGTRMKSDLPKGLHKVCGVSMVQLVTDALLGAGVTDVAIVVGHGGELVQAELGDRFGYAWQHEQLGTGHAVRCAEPVLKEFQGDIIVTAGDTPLVTEQMFSDLIAAHSRTGAACTVATSIQENPTGYGRILREENGTVGAIVEQKDATPEQLAIQEVNAAIYVFRSEGFFDRVNRIGNENAQGEYYFTDIIHLLREDGLSVEAYVCPDPDVLVGINDRWQLQDADRRLRYRTLENLARSGVTIVDPESTYVSPGVKVGRDTTIEPNTYLYGTTQIGDRCSIGPNVRLVDTLVGSDVLMLFANAQECEIGDECKVGPFANIRPKSRLEVDVNIGNFVEVNRSVLHDGVKARHLAYIGDAEVGTETNIGAGTITCNYDGFFKHKTNIGANAFIGSNSTLIAPVSIGDRAIVTAGSVITDPIADDAGAFARARQITRDGWAKAWRSRKAAEKENSKKENSKE